MSQTHRIVTRSNSQEMKHSQENNEENSNNMNQPRLTRKRKKLSPDQFDLTEYECPLCLGLFEDVVFQCPNDQLICDLCYSEFNISKCTTPKISMDQQNQNEMAERNLALRMVRCTNKDCQKIMQYSHLKDHIKYECLYQLVSCKYKSLSCNWEGIRKCSITHQNKCVIDLDKILEITNKKILNHNNYNKIMNLMNASTMYSFFAFDSDNDDSSEARGVFGTAPRRWRFELKVEDNDSGRNVFIRLVTLWYLLPNVVDIVKYKIGIIVNIAVAEPLDFQFEYKEFEIIINHNAKETPTEWIKLEPRNFKIEDIVSEDLHYGGVNVKAIVLLEQPGF